MESIWEQLNQLNEGMDLYKGIFWIPDIDNPDRNYCFKLYSDLNGDTIRDPEFATTATNYNTSSGNIKTKFDGLKVKFSRILKGSGNLKKSNNSHTITLNYTLENGEFVSGFNTECPLNENCNYMCYVTNVEISDSYAKFTLSKYTNDSDEILSFYIMKKNKYLKIFNNYFKDELPENKD